MFYRKKKERITMHTTNCENSRQISGAITVFGSNSAETTSAHLAGIFGSSDKNNKSEGSFVVEKMAELNVEAVLIQVRDALNRNDIKLWQEPYCVEGESIVESVEVSLEISLVRNLTRIFFVPESCTNFVPTDRHQIRSLSHRDQRTAEYGA
jgi:hypothetical protein